LKPAIFAVVTAGILYYSRDSLKNPASHGFPRFFAFESILILVLLNADKWLLSPFSPHQLISWLLLFGSIMLAVHGFYMLLSLGKPKGKWENTTSLITTGAFSYIRHPLYCSLLMLGWGAFLKDPSIIGGALAVANSAFLAAAAKAEEKEMLEKFGDKYADYMVKTRLFIPFFY